MLNKQLSIVVLCVPNAEIDPPCSKAIENIKSELRILTLSEYKSIDPPLPNPRDEINCVLLIVRLSESEPANIVPPFTENESLNVVLYISPFAPSQSIDPP